MAANVSSSTIQLSIFNDTSPEINETFTVQLSNPTGGARLGDQSEITITILSNDNAHGRIGFEEVSVLSVYYCILGG